ncbi:MAG: hypothetical protein HY331_00585 [Chloroflexi bacterium]|nr:hypothetical protein [Chloroflexota bacterium]
MRRRIALALTLGLFAAFFFTASPPPAGAWWPEESDSTAGPGARRGVAFSVFPTGIITQTVAVLRTRPRPTTANQLPADVGYARQTTWLVDGLPEIGAMIGNVTVTLQMVERCFPGVSGPVCAFRPGDEYAQIFIRDTSTILLAARYFYPDEYLRTAIEEFLALQYTDETEDRDGAIGRSRPGAGAVSGTVDSDHRTDKATAVTDEETTLLHAAYLYYVTRGGPEWLRRPIAGLPIVERLNRAIEWLYSHRVDAQTGLVKRAHTTDWGDVKMESGEPTDINPERDVWTASLYDQAWTYRALLELAEMNRAVGDLLGAQVASARAAELKRQTRLRLWQPERGYFRTHIHLTPLVHPFEEDRIVSIANALAVYAGLSEGDEPALLFTALERARRAAGSIKPGVVLYPPYPERTFHYERMAPGEYQNGGQWDWWAGFQIAAEFQSGESMLALAHLTATAREWMRHPGDIWEWQVADTMGRGGVRHYAGSAGTMTLAVVNGLFGVELTRDRFAVVPRLGERDGYVRVYQPATDRYLAARQRTEDGTIVLEYGTNHPRAGRIGIRLPDGLEPLSVTLDGRSVQYQLRTVGGDRLIVLEQAPGDGVHRLAVGLR